MAKKKLQRFAEVDSFSHCFFMSYETAIANAFELKGKWSSSVFKNNNPIVLELGCGKGEYSVGLAQKHTHKNFIGTDIKGNRIWVGAKKALNDKINNAAFLRTRIENISSAFSPNEISEIWITFPDPQPKRENKRLTSLRFLEKYKEFIAPGAPINLKTDNQELYEFTLQTIADNNFKLISHTDDLYANMDEKYEEVKSIQTHYENLFSQKGFTIKYVKFQIN